MKISLCIPQYNRIKYLIRNLEILSKQTYKNIEIVVSDDASTDNTKEEIDAYNRFSRFPVVYYRHEKNVGYDANLRKSMELASGDYCFILGNDDTLFTDDVIERVVTFLIANNLPEIGFCNYIEDKDHREIISRAPFTGVAGSGFEVALKFGRSFSFVGGIIIRKDVFSSVNTEKADGSIFVQMYLATLVIARGGRLFMFKEPLVLKDIRLEGSMANSYRDTLIKEWADYKVIDGGMRQVIWALVQGFKDAGADLSEVSYRVIANVYKYTYPFWLLDYRSNGAFVAAWGLKNGMKPSLVKELNNLSVLGRIRIKMLYYSTSLIGLTLPLFIFDRYKLRMHKMIKS
jgi:glycosyltransferase involved in cell wall biosynthesis